ncbi:serine hydrolase [Paenibacillus sambharensis]|uniref:Serine hydrolase n=2 Tax=Paenibacillus sambharensis TaxID=1803190 RepID=A0A2W1LED6_9BACL|nr:serine hydrolase [Paenibacillus sambharensis]
MKLILICMAAALGLSAPSSADAERPDIDTDTIDNFIVSAMQKLHIPGAALGIVKGDQLLYQQGYGYAGPDKTPVTPQTSFVIGSVSKSFTALAVMQLADQGRIDLEAPVQQYLPWFRLADEAASSKLLVKHLLHQTSGLSTYDGQKSLTKGNQPIEQHLRSLGGTRLTEPVGSVFQYSNLNYDILGGIIESASGMSYKEYINKHIFIPLHMNNSFGSPDDVTNLLAAGYQPVFGFMLPTRQAEHQGTVPSGYLISSVEDMTNYMIAQLNKGDFRGVSVVSEQSAELMHRPAAPMWGDNFYAMGWTVNNNRIYHDGSTENTYSKIVLEGDYGIVLLTNSIDFFHIDSYDQLMEGVSRILHGNEPMVDIADPDQTYLVIGIIVLIALAYTARSVYTLITWRSRLTTTRLKLIMHALEVLLLNIVIPLIILLLVPKLLVPWSVIFVFLVGIGHFMFVIPVILLTVGAAKAVLLLLSIRKLEL